ncbi:MULTISPECIES: helix-turn-helix transcriptional regulator [Rahnella]|jgi:DNA-binding NarL/FixJ family response regulator|uniref:helix-turn-helix transcriptional regulator n=1 Tax=Rahnella TaxID=34037 RepID=UPI0010507137|nr:MULTISPECIES: LuxR C-terminal-related transcriptional regulator [Rahnella]MBU9831857.1 helix-turn-helix transcriptional regulator [Rahnella rivi]TCQ86888.1 DNA-binding NarL/FixJ family response regulator [Rahnella sp. JUb53]
MLSYGNSLFSIYCKDYYFKVGLQKLLDDIYHSHVVNVRLINRHESRYNDYFQADIVVLSSRSIFEKLPERSPSLDRGGAVIVFCTFSMSEVVRGIRGYENALFIAPDTGLDQILNIFKMVMFGSPLIRNNLFVRTENLALTNKERKVSDLLRKGLSHNEISTITGITPKTVSSHLRSAMQKYKVSTLLEYRIKLIHMQQF